jgi:hypothetical protein
MMNGLMHAARDAADQLGRLLGWLSRVADPGALAFASELERLGAQLRPPGMPPGPYAPQPGVDTR